MSSLKTDSWLKRAERRSRPVIGRISPGELDLALSVPDSVRRDVVGHMMQCLPYEGVGLLAARSASRRMIANRFYAGRNIDASAERYTMDPVDVHVALEDMEQRGLRLLAI